MFRFRDDFWHFSKFRKIIRYFRNLFDFNLPKDFQSWTEYSIIFHCLMSLCFCLRETIFVLDAFEYNTALFSERDPTSSIIPIVIIFNYPTIKVRVAVVISSVCSYACIYVKNEIEEEKTVEEEARE